MSRSIVRTVIVAVLSLLVVITTLPGLSLVWDSTDSAWTPEGELGIQTDYDGFVKSVAPDSPASEAGIVKGDRIDLFQTSFESREYVAGAPARAPAGKHVPIWVNHRGVDRFIDLVPTHADLPLIPKVNLVNRTIAALLFVAVGGLLVLLRPSWMTWGFFFYCLGFSPGIAFASFYRYPPATMHAADIIGGDLLTAAGTVGILLFALGFLNDDLATWRRRLVRTAPVLYIVFALLIVYPDFANLILGWPAELAQRIMLTLQGLVFALAIFAVVQTYIHGAPENRPRIQWVVVGLFVGVVGNYVGDVLAFSSALPFTVPRWFESSLLVLNITLPLTVAYAVVRHRVFEVSFVVSRALVYAVLTFVIASVFSLIEYFVGHELEAVRLAQIIEIVLAIGVSFWIKALETRVEKIVDVVFFRRRREAMQRLERDANALHRASEPGTVDKYLVQEAIDALALSSAALFRRDGTSFERSQSAGWPATALKTIDQDDKIVLTLESESQPLRTAEIGWQHAGLPAGNAAPILAIPIMDRRDLAGFVMYGPHSNGADVDPEEVQRLYHLCRSAQFTYEEIRLEQLTRQVDELRAEVTRLQNGGASPQVAARPEAIERP
ncbi:MAG TPA: hypothetical protein VEJ41_02150 [Candidatus Acidoferrales bacterium]|nr:hypothetical protein [Candidatus Acidoferrales bacterium]